MAVLEALNNLIEANLVHEVCTLLDVRLGHADVHLRERDWAVRVVEVEQPVLWVAAQEDGDVLVVRQRG